MAFDNQYPKRKDWRRQYHAVAASVSPSCRPGGSCPYCRANRTHKHKRRQPQED